MAIFLGVDTGGTYTDAVILDEAANAVLGKAKALTSRHDLAVGIGEAVDAAIAAAGVGAADVALVSLSTTLATNALIERKGAKTALVTTEREGIRSHRRVAITSTQQSITVPITDDDVPNVFVSVLLVKGRTTPPPTAAAALQTATDTSDPGKPSFRLGYVQLTVQDRTKRLTVNVSADREEYRPASKATVKVAVKDLAGAGAASEVTLWAVDYGVLSLTGNGENVRHTLRTWSRS